MNLYVYSDESGVFDYVHNDYFLFGGLICFGEKEKDKIARKYAHAEKTLRECGDYQNGIELKATNISNADKGRLFRSLNNVFKFCVLIKEKEIQRKVFENKKHKQRYLDYAYKIVLKKCFAQMISKKILNPAKVERIIINADEHSTATDGRYELRENLLCEFKSGTFNYTWETFYEPIFPKIQEVAVNYCDSKSVRLVRAADIIANRFYHSANENHGSINAKNNTFVFILPDNSIESDGFEYFKK